MVWIWRSPLLTHLKVKVKLHSWNIDHFNRKRWLIWRVSLLYINHDMSSSELFWYKLPLQGLPSLLSGLWNRYQRYFGEVTSHTASVYCPIFIRSIRRSVSSSAFSFVYKSLRLLTPLTWVLAEVKWAFMRRNAAFCLLLYQEQLNLQIEMKTNVSFLLVDEQ